MSFPQPSPAVIHRTLPPGGEIVYQQTPTPAGVVQEVQDDDSWDLAAQNEDDVTPTGVVIDIDDSSSSVSVSSSSSSSSASVSGAPSAAGTTASGNTISTTGTTSATSSTGTSTNTGGIASTGTAISGANRMTTAVPANVSLRETLRAHIRPYHVCACATLIFLTAGTVFTLMAKGDIQQRDSGFVYPEEVTFDKALAGIWFGVATIVGGCSIWNAVQHYRRGCN